MNRYKEISRLAFHHEMMWLLALLLCMAMPFSAFSQELHSEAVFSCNMDNEEDYGGKPTTTAKVVIVTKGLDFTIPAVPEASFDPESGELIIFDTKGEPHVPINSVDLIENLRLDYAGTSFAKDKGFAVIEFKCESNFDIDQAFNTVKRNTALPYTNTGMTGSKFNVIPEYVNEVEIKFSEGDVMKVYNNDGRLIQTYKMDNGSWE